MDFYNHFVGPRVPTARSARIDASCAARNRLPATIVQTMSASPPSITAAKTSSFRHSSHRRLLNWVFFAADWGAHLQMLGHVVYRTSRAAEARCDGDSCS